MCVCHSDLTTVQAMSACQKIWTSVGIMCVRPSEINQVDTV